MPAHDHQRRIRQRTRLIGQLPLELAELPIDRLEGTTRLEQRRQQPGDRHFGEIEIGQPPHDMTRPQPALPLPATNHRDRHPDQFRQHRRRVQAGHIPRFYQRVVRLIASNRVSSRRVGNTSHREHHTTGDQEQKPTRSLQRRDLPVNVRRAPRSTFKAWAQSFFSATNCTVSSAAWSSAVAASANWALASASRSNEAGATGVAAAEQPPHGTFTMIVRGTRTV